jgi:hypothetical protein
MGQPRRAQPNVMRGVTSRTPQGVRCMPPMGIISTTIAGTRSCLLGKRNNEEETSSRPPGAPTGVDMVAFLEGDRVRSQA